MKIFWGIRGMEDRFSGRYRHFNSWITFLKNLTASQFPILPPMMGEYFALWALLHRSEGSAEGTERQRWGQWLQPDHSHSYTSTVKAGVNISFTNKAAGQAIPPWNQIPAVPWHVQNTWYVSESQKLNISFYLRRKEDCFPCKPHHLQPPLSSSYIDRDTFNVKSILQGHTEMYGKEMCPDTTGCTARALCIFLPQTALGALISIRVRHMETTMK